MQRFQSTEGQQKMASPTQRFPLAPSFSGGRESMPGGSKTNGAATNLDNYSPRSALTRITLMRPAG